VTRLQNRIAEQQAERRTDLKRERRKFSYSELYHRRFPRIACRKGRQLVQSEGFYRVDMLECQGRIFTYLARANGKMVRVMVDSRFGTIIGTTPF
jgi:hypothetical protein